MSDAPSAYCPHCGADLSGALTLWVDIAAEPSQNGASTPRRTRQSRTRNLSTKAKHRSAYHAFVSEGRQVGSSMAEIQQAWRDQKAVEA